MLLVQDSLSVLVPYAVVKGLDVSEDLRSQIIDIFKLYLINELFLHDGKEAFAPSVITRFSQC